MSQAEIERFVADLKSNEALRSELSGHASGIGSAVSFAKDKGYDITSDEAGSYISAQAGRDLSDSDLDAVAGGKSFHHDNQTTTTDANVALNIEAAAMVAAGASVVVVIVAT
ncbi:MAG: Nif11-like leader peptide family natural product precursor [Rhodospirillaceae bacterium]|mgnify:FL=1|jgi:predicted ribosomally synthesized peptide with nif11-like leader|nr:Nif11-like leader peptide family natural product precursor [Rhodospirillaceae bacterium]MBT3808201.1 Nif11-like leader peptide family natural product precursor [Rhodospirillaceae bacterium]MBT3931387.1 Nif11-like leader peptide family natural product precursor [Rhodospirillaceae bacterium]MBT4773364.1 Nif11-like leader peptide family natural product precursor [Rhodospirillaceae bacterium]MBT5359978.1 Nif11-like leader peptide family natural product precursor [Rhodospirillaceae bacterium]